MTSRREFLATIGAALGAGALGGCARAVEAASPRPPLARIGIQLYTLRSLLAKDFDGTLAKVAAIGYREVEFADYFKRSPAEIRAALQANGLASPAAHVGIPATDDDWKRTLDTSREIGHQWVVIPWLDAGMRKSPDDWTRVADRWNELGTMAKAAGLRFAYHNHDFELKRVDDRGTGLEILLSRTTPALVDFEMDLYWVVKGGGDPLDFIRRHPQRFPLVHVKDATAAPARAMVDVGSGTIDFAAIFAKSGTSGMKHAFVEHDNPPDPIASATSSYRYLASLKG